MATINLLPWRDEHREEKQREFLTVLGGVAFFAAFVAYLWIGSIDSAIAKQNARNDILNKEIAKLEQRVKDIREIKKRKAELLRRMKVIQNLQGERPVIVRYFDELVKVVPKGIHILSLDKKGDTISIKGITESNVRVSDLMRNIDASQWFDNPNLSSVKADKKQGPQASQFNLTFKATKPSDEKEQEKGQ